MLMKEIFDVGENGTLPTHGTSCSAGYDVYASASKVLHPQFGVLVPTDLRLSEAFRAAGNPSIWLELRDRSGLAVKGLHVFAGVIDSDYPDEIGVVLQNFSFKRYDIKRGDRICQFIPHGFTVSVAESNTNRQGGFGSTGS